MEALSLQGNLWIYGIRNELMIASFDHITDTHEDNCMKEVEVSKQYVPPTLASLLAIRKEPLANDNNELNHFVSLYFYSFVDIKHRKEFKSLL